MIKLAKKREALLGALDGIYGRGGGVGAVGGGVVGSEEGGIKDDKGDEEGDGDSSGAEVDEGGDCAIRALTARTNVTVCLAARDAAAAEGRGGGRARGNYVHYRAKPCSCCNCTLCLLRAELHLP